MNKIKDFVMEAWVFVIMPTASLVILTLLFVFDLIRGVRFHH